MLLTIELHPVIVIATRRFISKIMLAEIVDIGPLGMGDFSQHSLLHHVQRSQGKSIITTILQHHAMTASRFGCIYQSPAIGNTHGGRDFQCHMTALLHGINGNIGMRQPIRTNINKVYLFTFAHLAPHPFLRIVLGLGTAEFIQYMFCPFYIFSP